MTNSTTNKPTPKEALALLKEGNARFVAGWTIRPHATPSRRGETAKHGQKPFATVLACSDSRLPVEMVFDCGIGDLFVIRIAGNVCGVHEAGSIEYGIGYLDTPLVVVLAHTQCGAVAAVVNETTVDGNLAGLLQSLRPALEDIRTQHPDLPVESLIPHIVESNMWKSIADLLTSSEKVAELVRTSRLAIVGGIYDIETGMVDFLGPHPHQAELLST